MSIPFLSNITIDDAGHIQFKTAAGVSAGKIDQDGNNLVLTNAVGDILLGDGSSDVYIGDGTNNVDIIFEQSGSIKGDGSAVTLTLGGANTTLNLENPNFTGNISMSNKLTFTSANGYILFDHEPSGDTGAYEGSTSVPLLKIDKGGTEKVILERISQEGGLLLGADDSVMIAAGDVRGTLRDNLNEGAENVILASETGFHAYGFPNNMSGGWSARQEFRFYTGGTDASLNGLWIGSGGNTQFIDLNRNLKNIGTIESGAIDSSGQIKGEEIEGTSLDINGSGDISGNLDVHQTITANQLNLDTIGDYITFYGGGETNHSITSRELGGGTGDDIRVNTYGSFIVNLDSNDNQSSASNSSFFVGRHGGNASSISGTNLLFQIDGQTGNVLPGADSTHDLGTSSNRWANIYADTLYGDGSNLTNLPTQAAPSNMVTTDGSQTITHAKNFTSASMQHNGHLYYNAYDSQGQHYPHFRDGSASNGADINWRHYYGSSNYKTHTWTSDASGNMAFTFQGDIKAVGELEGTSLDINGNADVSGNITVSGTVDGVDVATLKSDFDGLGSAANFASSAFATSAQGTKADNAMPKTGGTFTGDVTITHADTPRINIIDTTNDTDFRIRAANSYVYIEADTDNDADSTRIHMKVDDNLVHEFLPGSQVSHKNLTLRREDTHPSYTFQSRRDSGNFTSGTDLARINFQARDSVVTPDTTLAVWIVEADNTFTTTDKKTRMKFQVHTGSSNESVLFLDSDKSATLYGTLFVPQITATADTYSSGQSEIIYKAQRTGGAVAGDWSYDDATTDMSLGTSTGHSFSLKTGNTRALTIDSSQNASFTGNIAVSGTVDGVDIAAFKTSFDNLSIPSISGLATETYVDTAVSNLIDNAPDNLNTLNELAEALNDDDDAIVTINTALSNRYTKTEVDNFAVKLSGDQTITGVKNFTGELHWDLSSGEYAGDPRAVVMGYSGGNYGQLGYNIDFTSTAGSHTRVFNDIPTRMDLYDGIKLYSSTAGSAGTAITWGTTLLRVQSNGFQYKGNNIYYVGNDSGILNSNVTLSSLGAQAAGNYITGSGSLSAQDLTDIGNLSGTNTGDQDLSGFVTKSSAQVISGDKEFQGDKFIKVNKRVTNSQKYPIGHYTPGETMFEIDPTWSDSELKEFFDHDDVSWATASESENAPGGYAIKIDGSVGVGGVYNSGFPYIPIDEDGIYYMEVWIKNHSTSSGHGHYMGSIDYESDFTHPSSGGGNPGSYGYFVMSNTNPGTSWVKKSGYITGHHNSNTGAFETDATYFTPMALFNYTAPSSGSRICYISGWKVIRVDHVGNRTFQDDVYVKGKLEVHTLDTNTSSTTALVMNSNEVEKRTLGSNAFTSTSYLPLAGGSMSGDLNFNSNYKITHTQSGGIFDLNSNSNRVFLQTNHPTITFQIDADNTSGDSELFKIGISTASPAPLSLTGDALTLGSGKIILSGTGTIQCIDTVTNSTDAASKGYVDGYAVSAANGGTFSGDIEATGMYVGATNTSFDLYNNGTSYFNGSTTVDANLTVSAGSISITADGSNAATLTESGSGDFEIHAQDDLRLNADGHDIVLKGDSNEFGRLSNDSQNFVIKNITADKAIFLKATSDHTGSDVTENYLGLLGSFSSSDGAGGAVFVYRDFLMAQDDTKIRLGASQDLEIYHDGSNSYIEDSGTGDLFLKASNDIYLQASNNEYMAEFSENGSVDLYYNGSKKFETTSSGIDVTGGGRFTGEVRFTSGATFDNNSKAQFGDDQDLEIYHSGSHAYINGSNGVGSLYIRPGSGGTVQIEDNSSNDMITASAGGAVNLYYNNSKKFETKSDGGVLTGNLTVSQDLTVSGGDISLGGTGRIQGVDTVSSSTDAANKAYVDAHVPSTSQTIITSNFDDGTNTSAWINMPMNYFAESGSNTTYYHYFNCPAAGTVKKITMMHVSGSMTIGYQGTTTQLRVVKNGTGQTASGNLLADNGSSDGSKISYSPNTTFAAGDRLQFQFKRSNSSLYWKGTAVSIVIEFTQV